MAVVEAFDNFAGLRNALRDIAKERGDWAGIPMPLDGERLIIEPKYPKAKELSDIWKKTEEPLPTGVKLRNEWWSDRLRCYVLIWEEDGKIEWGRIPGMHHITNDLRTLACSEAWGIEQERNALEMLGTLINHRQMKQYLITGSFPERSKRSGLTYLFRRLKPTVVLDARENGKKNVRMLCALCLHPIAYYDGSWAGAMCPTDDVVAHLMLMRGDEPMLWRRSNQHEPSRPEAGI